MMKHAFFLSLIVACSTCSCLAQQDSAGTVAYDLLSELEDETSEEQKLLPDHFFVTQRLLWGKRGLMRTMAAFELTPDKRQRELRVRRVILTTHQALGFATLGAMVAQAIVGIKLYNGDRSLKDTHEALAIAINSGYFTAAGLALFAPPRMADKRKGLSSMKLHKVLAAVHFSAMIATNVLAEGAEGEEGSLQTNNQGKALHRAAALTAFGSYATAMIVLKF